MTPSVGFRRQNLRASTCRSAVKIAAGLRIIESYDGKFELAKESEENLKQLLGSPTFAKQVAQETGQTEGTELAFTGMLFQPVPWSMQTKKGMPADFEKYAADPDYVIINTPPNFMFQAKIFKPSRLCAIYKKK
ncbi:g11128 [Coccomyxa viridis]|uniref:G11128 protein n=1 Tax=Coccomyxa viridis TaxID=1274662 RepID=A0ABP1G9U1_9CHLO